MKNKNIHRINGEIYITAPQEDIKENDHFHNRATNEILFASKEMLAWNNDTTQEHKGWTKVIMTSDKQLDVQKIDSSVLSFLAENPKEDYLSDFDIETIKFVTKQRKKHNDWLSRNSAKETEISPEQETLDRIKYVLSMKNEAQGIRILEQYKEYVINKYKETLT